MSNDERWAYSVTELAARLGVSRATIYRLISERKLDAVKIGARTVIPAAAGQALLDAPTPSPSDRGGVP